MRASRLTGLLKKSFLNHQRVLIVGKPGTGKTDLVHQVVEELHADMVLMHPAISDPTDFKGMPALTNGGTEAHFLPFGDLSRLCKATKLMVAFQDDVGQAPPAVQAALMQLNLSRSVNGTRISDKVVFVGATNDTMHMSGVSGMIEPLKSRWDTIVTLDVSHDDWIDWALYNGMPAWLIAYIRTFPAALSEFKPTKELRNSPNPRGWAAVGKWSNINVNDLEVWTGTIGEARAVEAYGYWMMHEQLPNIDNILLDPKNAPVPEIVTITGPDGKARTFTATAVHIAIASALANKATPGNFERVMTYMDRLAKEFSVFCVRDAIRRDKKLCATKAFIAWSVKNQGVLM